MGAYAWNCCWKGTRADGSEFKVISSCIDIVEAIDTMENPYLGEVLELTKMLA